ASALVADLVAAERKIRFSSVQCGLADTCGQRLEAGARGINPEVMGDQLNQRDIETGVAPRIRGTLGQPRYVLDGHDEPSTLGDPVNGRRAAAGWARRGDGAERVAGHHGRSEQGVDPVDGLAPEP